MPGFTPNRAYPYPVSTDPTNVPGDTQNLAEAWDADLTTVDATIIDRPTFRVFSSTTQTFPVFFSNTFQLTFDQLDLNNSGALAQPVTLPNNLFRPTLPGMWYLTATFSYARPALTPSPNFDEFGISLTAGATVFAKRNTHSEPVAGENRGLAVGTVVFLDGNTDISVVGTFNPITSIRNYSVYNRSFTGFRMTES
jgi:hypothetical protein